MCLTSSHSITSASHLVAQSPQIPARLDRRTSFLSHSPTLSLSVSVLIIDQITPPLPTTLPSHHAYQALRRCRARCRCFCPARHCDTGTLLTRVS
jgi:hypothetical protein